MYNQTHSSPKANTHRVNVCDIQKAYTKRMQRTVYQSIREIQSLYKAYKQYSSNPFGNTTIGGGTRLFDRLMEEKNKRLEEVITSTDLTHNSRKEWTTIIQEYLQ